MFTIPQPFKAHLTTIKWLAGIALFAAWTAAVYWFASSNTQTACDRDTAQTEAAGATLALGASESFRVRGDLYFKGLQGATNAFQLNAQADDLLFADAVAAGDGLRVGIEEAVNAASCGLPDSAAAERASQAARALGAALAACDKEQRSMAKDLADALNRGKTCQAEHEQAVIQSAAPDVPGD